jgi:putative DNA primase/helicase
VSVSSDRISDALRAAGKIVKPGRDGHATAQCPAHDDHKPSLSIYPKPNGKGSNVKCHAQDCDRRDILAKIGLTIADTFDDQSVRDVYKDRVDYPYPNRVKRRYLGVNGDKTFAYTPKGVKDDHALYAAERLQPEHTHVLLCEGEKAAEMCWRLGYPAVSTGGAKRDCDFTPLRGRHVKAIVDRDQSGLDWMERQQKALDGVAESAVFKHAAVETDHADIVEHFEAGYTLDELVDITPNPNAADVADAVEFDTTRLADVTAEPVRWLWRDRLPLGKLIMLDGDPSTGKSTLSLAIASTVTTGGTWPDETVCEHPGAVVLLTAEDSLADTVRPRLDAAGALVADIHAVNGVPIGDGALRMADLNDIGPLRRLVERIRARLVIVDVLMAYVPTGNDSHRDQDIRHVLGRLAALAEQTRCTVLLLRHLTKGGGPDPPAPTSRPAWAGSLLPNWRRPGWPARSLGPLPV